MNPTIGRIVHYVLSELDADRINRRRVKNATLTDEWVKGTVAHIGNHAKAGQKFPAIVTAIHTPGSTDINGQVFLDGNDNLWITSAQYEEFDAGNALEGAEPQPGTWHWPSRT